MAQQSALWEPADLSFEILDDMTDDPVMTLLVNTPAGRITFVAEPEEQGATLVLRGTHAQGLWPGAVGAANLRVLARAVLERMGYDELVVEGALRTTGAGPGRRPRPLRFARGLRPADRPGRPTP